MNELLSHWLGVAQTRGLRILVIALLAVILARILKAVTSRLVQASKGPTRVAQLREQQTRTMAGLLYSLGLWLIVAVAILTTLPELGFDVTPVAATAAVASLAFGFGAQTLVKDLINGFFIVFEDQYVVGDLIQVNGETGRVEYLTLRRTVLRNASGAIVTIPNSLVGQVANLNRDWSQAFIDVTVPSAEEIGRSRHWKTSRTISATTPAGLRRCSMGRACWAWNRCRSTARCCGCRCARRLIARTMYRASCAGESSWPSRARKFRLRARIESSCRATQRRRDHPDFHHDETISNLTCNPPCTRRKRWVK
jgi:hypothetical protein